MFGLSRRAVASFEEPVRSIKGTYHRIDLFWKGRLLAEHKSAGRDLTKAKGQAFDYVQDLIREGGHSHRRIIHAADATGVAISTTLVKRVQECDHIQLLENRVAIDLITTKKLGLENEPNRVVGAYVLNKATGQVELFRARFVALATGGASRAYFYTCNPDIATGDGIAMAWRCEPRSCSPENCGGAL